MTKNVCVIGTALTDVRGRIRYMTSPDKQEHMEAYVSNMPKGGWLELSKYSRHQAALYHPGEKVCEARELIIILPNDLSRFNAQNLAIALRDQFSAKHGVPCAVAVHWNKKKNNYHAHLVFSERAIHRQPQGISIATRNTYFDANGKRSNKKDCLDELGSLKPGCRFVKKGEALSEGSRFGPKKNIFAQEEWMRAEKQRMVDFFNANSRDETWKVYDWKNDPHFPYLRIVKGDPAGLNAWRERENEWRRTYNDNIDRLINVGDLTVKEALQLKFKAMENKSRLRRERAENRKRWVEQWQKAQARTVAEREYFRSLRKKSAFGLAVELALAIAGVDVVKLQSGTERVMRDNKSIKAYHDVKIQEMADEVYRASGKKTPSEEIMLRTAAGEMEAKLLQSEAQKQRNLQSAREKTLIKENLQYES